MTMEDPNFDKDAIKKCVGEMLTSLERLGNKIVARDGNPDYVYSNASAALGVLIASHVRAYAALGNNSEQEVRAEFEDVLNYYLAGNPLEAVRPQGNA